MKELYKTLIDINSEKTERLIELYEEEYIDRFELEGKAEKLDFLMKQISKQIITNNELIKLYEAEEDNE